MLFRSHTRHVALADIAKEIAYHVASYASEHNPGWLGRRLRRGGVGITGVGNNAEICRWHHERYDGKGYPDGLKGEEIPIAAQVVSVADVYDALTSERVYKKAFSHEKAMEMILAGECGTFNPLLLECLQDIQGNIQVEMKRAAEQPMLVQNSYVGKMIETVQ